MSFQEERFIDGVAELMWTRRRRIDGALVSVPHSRVPCSTPGCPNTKDRGISQCEPCYKTLMARRDREANAKRRLNLA